VENQEEPIRFENGFFLSKKFLPYTRELFLFLHPRLVFHHLLEGVRAFLREILFCGKLAFEVRFS
jgi:hypothetical protein